MHDYISANKDCPGVTGPKVFSKEIRCLKKRRKGVKSSDSFHANLETTNQFK
jgi:hypothetical protein